MAGTATKASIRRKVLLEVQKLANEMIQINESAYRQGIIMVKTKGVLSGETDRHEAIDTMLGSCGLATGIDGTDPTISDKIVGIIHDAATNGGDGNGHVSIRINGTDYYLTNGHLTES